MSDVSPAARRGRRRRRVAAVVVAAAIAAPLVIFQIRDAPRVVTAADVPLQVSAVERRQPLGETAAGAMDTAALVHPGAGSLVAARGPESIYLLEAVGDRLCVLVVNEGSGGAGSSCHPRSNLVDTGIIHAHPPATTGPTAFIVVAPDGYTRARAGDGEAAVVSNVAIVEVNEPQRTLTISGPAVPDVTFPLGVAGAAVGTATNAGPSETETNARAALADLSRAAQAYQRQHGTTTGFAEQVVADSAPVGRQMASLTDTTAVARIGPQRCLRADLLAGRIDERPC